MIRAELQEIVRHALRDSSCVVVRFSEEEDGHGVVAYVRAEDYDSLIVHRWADHDSAGNPMEPMLWSGFYTSDPRRWVADFEQRAREPWMPDVGRTAYVTGEVGHG